MSFFSNLFVFSDMSEKTLSLYISKYGQLRTMFAPKNVLDFLTRVEIEVGPLLKSKISINPIQVKLLQHLCAKPGGAVYEMYKNRALGKDIDYRALRRCVSDLSQKGLIIRHEKEDNRHKAKLCTVTTAGIIYLILTRNVMYRSTILHIFQNYGNNMLFEQFLFPLISLDTLQQLTTFNSLSPIEMYLYDCCRELVHTFESIITAKYRNVMQQIFVWQDVPNNKEQTNTLIRFLKRKFNLNWIDDVESSKISKDGDTLRIGHKSNVISITLDNVNSKATLKIGREIKYDFIIEHPPEGYLVLLAPLEPIEEINAVYLDSGIKRRVTSFILNLLSNVLADTSDFYILSQDRRFLQIAKNTIKKLNSQYELLIR